MAIIEIIQQHFERLPASFQAEVLDFVEYLLIKVERGRSHQEERAWSEWSLALAMRGLEDEDTPTYTYSDLKVMFS